MDAYFSETISREEMLQMKAKYDGELEKLVLQLGREADVRRIQEEQAQGLDELVRTIRESVTRSEEVFGETVEGIVVYDEYITLKIRFLPLLFKIRYQTSGKRADYTVTITDCELCPLEADALDG